MFNNTLNLQGSILSQNHLLSHFHSNKPIFFLKKVSHKFVCNVPSASPGQVLEFQAEFQLFSVSLRSRHPPSAAAAPPRNEQWSRVVSRAMDLAWYVRRPILLLTVLDLLTHVASFLPVIVTSVGRRWLLYLRTLQLLLYFSHLPSISKKEAMRVLAATLIFATSVSAFVPNSMPFGVTRDSYVSVTWPARFF